MPQRHSFHTRLKEFLFLFLIFDFLFGRVKQKKRQVGDPTMDA